MSSSIVARPARPLVHGLGIVLLVAMPAARAQAQGYRWRWAESTLTAFPMQPGLTSAPVLFEPSGRWMYCGLDPIPNSFATIDWDGRLGRPLATPVAPAGRWGHCVAFDSVRQRVVVFGGFDLVTSVKRDDTWEWDGSAWTRRATQGPAACMRATATFDPATGRVLLFGGQADPWGAPSAETWSWDGQTWSRLQPPTSPPARFSAKLVADPVRQRLVLFGGDDAAGSRDDTWEWDGRTWLATTPTRRPPRSSRLAFDGMTRRVLLVAGNTDNGPVAETWAWSGSDWSRLRQRTDSIRYDDAVLASDPARQRFLCLVATPGGPLLMGWDGSDWSQALGGGPSAPLAPVYDHARRLVVAFENETLHEWNGERWTPRQPFPRPALRTHARLAYDAARRHVVLFGGQMWNTSLPLGDAYSWDGATWQPLGTPSAVPARYDHRMVFDEARGRLVVYGGFDAAGPRHDTWEWDGQRWQQVASGAPVHGTQYELAYDPRRNRTVFHSGPGPGETWEWDGVRWQQMQPVQPRGGYYLRGMCDHPELQRVVAIIENVLSSELWGWDGTTWSLLQAESHDWRYTPRHLVYHAARRRLLTFRSLDGAVADVRELVRDELSLTRSDVQLPGALDYRVQMPREAGRPFLILWSLGTGPGIPFRVDAQLGVEEVPLVPDALLLLTLGLGLGGVLDASGAGTFHLPLPAVPGLAGFSAYTGILTFDPSGVRSASPEVGFSLRG